MLGLTCCGCAGASIKAACMGGAQPVPRPVAHQLNPRPTHCLSCSATGRAQVYHRHRAGGVQAAALHRPRQAHRHHLNGLTALHGTSWLLLATCSHPSRMPSRTCYKCPCLSGDTPACSALHSFLCRPAGIRLPPPHSQALHTEGPSFDSRGNCPQSGGPRRRS